MSKQISEDRLANSQVSDRYGRRTLQQLNNCPQGQSMKLQPAHSVYSHCTADDLTHVCMVGLLTHPCLGGHQLIGAIEVHLLRGTLLHHVSIAHHQEP